MRLKHPSRTFRPWPENQQHFEFAETHRLNVSELINEIVAAHFAHHVQSRVKKLNRALTPKALNGHR